MYAIYKDSKRTFIRNTFASYDAARVFIRKMLRTRAKTNKLDLWGRNLVEYAYYSNPNLGDFGYSIKKI